jgi:hypothetical protein
MNEGRLGSSQPGRTSDSTRLGSVLPAVRDESIEPDKRQSSDMKDYVEITDDGKNYIALHDAVI